MSPEWRGAAVVLLPTLAGVIVGVLFFLFFPSIDSTGTPKQIAADHMLAAISAAVAGGCVVAVLGALLSNRRR